MVVVTSLVAFDVIHPTPASPFGLAAVLLIADGRLADRVPLFDRERLITGTRG